MWMWMWMWCGGVEGVVWVGGDGWRVWIFVDSGVRFFER
jgi:hypothetical protein